MAFRVAGPAAMAAPAIATLVLIAATIVPIIVIPGAAAGLHLVVALRTLLVAGRATALAAFPTPAGRSRVAFRITVPTAFAVARIIPAATRGLRMPLGIAVPAALAVATAFPAAARRRGMAFGIAKPPAGLATFRRPAAAAVTAVIVALPSHRSPAVTVVFVVIATARPRPAFAHEAPFFVSIASHGPEGSGTVMLVVALEAAARGAVVAGEAVFIITFAPCGAAAAAFAPETAIAVALGTAAGISPLVVGHEPALVVSFSRVEIPAAHPIPPTILPAIGRSGGVSRPQHTTASPMLSSIFAK